MLFYLFVGIFTSILAHIAISSYDRNKILFYVFFPLLILFPSIIEGCRDWNLGTDMLGYGSNYFYDSLHYNNVGTFCLILTQMNMDIICCAIFVEKLVLSIYICLWLH